jgi:hypothetical protein
MSISQISQWTTAGDINYGWYNGRKAGAIREKIVLSATSSKTLKKKLPASTQRYWAVLHYGTAPSFTWAATHNSPTGAVVLTDVAPTSLDGTVTTDVFLLGSTTLSANTKTRGVPANSKTISTTTSEVSLYVVPYAATTSASNTTRFSTSYAFGGTADVYVTVYFETFGDSPNV